MLQTSASNATPHQESAMEDAYPTTTIFCAAFRTCTNNSRAINTFWMPSTMLTLTQRKKNSHSKAWTKASSCLARGLAQKPDQLDKGLAAGTDIPTRQRNTHTEILTAVTNRICKMSRSWQRGIDLRHAATLQATEKAIPITRAKTRNNRQTTAVIRIIMMNDIHLAAQQSQRTIGE